MHAPPDGVLVRIQLGQAEVVVQVVLDSVRPDLDPESTVEAQLWRAGIDALQEAIRKCM